MDNYESFDAEVAGVRLLEGLMADLDPARQMALQQFMSPRATVTLPPIPRTDALVLPRSLDLQPHRQETLDLLVHESSALNVVPEQASRWVPLVHDSLLFFLDGLGDERLFGRVLNLIYMPAGASRGARLLKSTDRTPALQKIGQILARNPDLSADIWESLQQLENGMSTSNRDELVAFIEAELGSDTIDAHQIRFADEILAEASVGAVIRATLLQQGSSREVVFKIVKPYVLEALPQELAIIDQLAGFVQTESDAYGLGDVPLSDMFRDVKEALSSEIRIEDEQDNLSCAETYYADSQVTVPHMYPFSTERVTVMDFIAGEEITDALAGDVAGRRELAWRLADALTVDAIFSPEEEAIFRGDPHAGNIFHVSNDPTDRYRIALLDWGLYGSFPREQRKQLVQLVLGVHLGNTKRVRNNAGALLEGGLPTSPEDLAAIRSVVDKIVRDRQGIFGTL
jgi:ubiquinone biosynthesis protein